MIYGLLAMSANNSFKSCAGEGIAPKIAINIAPVVTRRVPEKDHLVKGSLRINDAHIELKTRPAACKVERTGSGSVEIWILLPRRFATMNIPMPICHLLLR